MSIDDDIPEYSAHIFGGGTIFHVRPHLALSAPAYGRVARQISQKLMRHAVLSKLHLTKMAAAGGGDLETNADVAKRVDELVADPSTKMIFMAAALCDFEAEVVKDLLYDGGYIETTPSGKDQPRLKTRATDGGPHNAMLLLKPSEKIIGSIRKTRKDIFLVGFKTTAGASPKEQYEAGLTLLKKSSCNLVLANDVHTRLNMVITPEQARYHETTDREEAIKGLVEMAVLRSKLHFTRSTVVPSAPVPWDSQDVPEALRRVVDYCLLQGCYKPFLGSTVGHFAVKIGEGKFLTSRRRTNFNDLYQVGLVFIETKDEDEVVAHGSSPSVGGQSQRIIFREHPDTDCIVHFHGQMKPGSAVPVRSQREFECGSHECGQNTSSGLKRFDLPRGQYLYAVMLDRHGPNIVFSRDVDPASVIGFLEENFQLGVSTDAFPEPS